jgi:hypothetical protein
MEDTASHETAYKLAHRADKANPWSDYYPTLGRIVSQLLIEKCPNNSRKCSISMCYTALFVSQIQQLLCAILVRGRDKGKRMGSNYLITSSAALVAITLAIFVFLLPKTVEIYHTRWKSMQNLDMPDNIRNSKRFRTEIFLDNIGMYVLAFASLLLAVYFTGILTNAISDYFGVLGTFLFNNPPQIEFLRALKWLFFLLSAMFGVSLLWLAAGSQISKTLPIITRAYAEMTLDVSRGIGVRQELLKAARSFFRKGAYN